MKKTKNLPISSIVIICSLCIVIGVLISIVGCFAWVYNTPEIKEAFIETYKIDGGSLLVSKDFGNILTGTIEINISKELLELNGKKFDYTLTEEQKKQGFTNIKRNKDDSATYTIKKKNYEKFIAEFKKISKQGIDELTKDGSLTSIKKITYNDDLSKITILADKSKFENSIDSMALFSCGLTSCVYQTFDVNAPGKCTVDVKDSVSGEIFKTIVYPDALNEN